MGSAAGGSWQARARSRAQPPRRGRSNRGFRLSRRACVHGSDRPGTRRPGGPTSSCRHRRRVAGRARHHRRWECPWCSHSHMRLMANAKPIAKSNVFGAAIKGLNAFAYAYVQGVGWISSLTMDVLLSLRPRPRVRPRQDKPKCARRGAGPGCRADRHRRARPRRAPC